MSGLGGVAREAQKNHKRSTFLMFCMRLTSNTRKSLEVVLGLWRRRQPTPSPPVGPT